MKKKSILVVGAGPVGLSGAWFLSMIPNLEVRIVEKQALNERQVLSKALSINPRTMEFFNKTSIQEEFLISSLKVNKMKVSKKDTTIIQADISDSVSGKTNFPHLHILPQTMTERAIQKQLNKKKIFVERQVQVLEVKNLSNANSHQVWVKMRNNKNGKVFQQQFDYLLATDGAHSTIRKMFGLKFQGQTLQTSIYLCDAQIQGSIPTDIETIIDDKNYLVIIPIKPNYVRIMGNSPQYLKNIPSNKFNILKISWRSQFLINNRVIQKMSIGNVYFAGDAAHVHAPLGNRGMNLGIQDVYIFANLLQKQKAEKYNQIRHQVVKNFVNKVNQLSKKMVTYDNTWEKKFFSYFGSIVGRMKKNEAILFVTGLDHKIPNFAKL